MKSPFDDFANNKIKPESKANNLMLALPAPAPSGDVPSPDSSDFDEIDLEESDGYFIPSSQNEEDEISASPDWDNTETCANSTPDETPPPLTRPGVKPQTLAANGVHRPTMAELETVYGFKSPGFIIPYLDRRGDPIMDGGRPFVRLRLDRTKRYFDKKSRKEKAIKYLQLKGTRLHIYIPREFDKNYKGALVIVEGEMKALSLVEAGIPALGIGGFYSFQTKGEMLPELADLLAALEPKALFFLGDGDTSHNALFSDAAVKMARLAGPRWVLLPRIPIDEAKGIDDVREAKGDDFPRFWQEIVNSAVLVLANTCPKRLCLFLLEREIPKIASLSGDRRRELRPRIEKMGRFKKDILDDKYRSLVKRAGL